MDQNDNTRLLFTHLKSCSHFTLTEISNGIFGTHDRIVKWSPNICGIETLPALTMSLLESQVESKNESIMKSTSGIAKLYNSGLEKAVLWWYTKQ